MRVALFGGSFDPPHRGHIAIATAAADAFALDRVLFTPAGRQPLKRNGHAASYDQRLEMCALACADADPRRFAVSTLDAPLADGSPNYTVRTLELLADEYPAVQRFNLVGADTFQHLGKWREPHRLIQLAEWIVVSRPGIPLKLPDNLTLTAAQRARIHLLSTVHEDVAATTLRQLLAGRAAGGGKREAGRVDAYEASSLDDLLPPSVAAYIAAHHLYSSLLQ
jgi:nicotinate-nucleotide adenylyltransferase